uniref:Uncharacterized protein n=1 Tax=Aegilops tauschii subsp. strangulata TaxID=200361 RepID=A0A453KSC4_AEGTS
AKGRPWMINHLRKMVQICEKKRELSWRNKEDVDESFMCPRGRYMFSFLYVSPKRTLARN